MLSGSIITGMYWQLPLFMYGMGNKELTREQLDNVDPNSQIVITIKAV
jgi:hypothetical protein